MSLLGIDVGTSGCKAAAFTPGGRLLALAYREYDVRAPQPGWAELDSAEVWDAVQQCIREAAAGTDGDPIAALAVSSLGEAVVPVTRDRRIVGPSILNFDTRGSEYLATIGEAIDREALYRLNGNILGNHYGITKLMWLRDHATERPVADWLLPWGSLVSFLLGAEPCIDASLANRLLIFGLAESGWDRGLCDRVGIDSSKLPRPVSSGTPIGTVSPQMALDLGLPQGVEIVVGAHDQCANAVGCGVIEPGAAAYGMGTFLCITPVFAVRPDPTAMMGRGLSTEHHAVPDRFVTFIYNQGGSLLKWYRDTFAHAEAGRPGVYDELLAEMPKGPSGVVALPHFTTTGPPEFVSDSCGMLAGLRLESSRGEVLRGILEGCTFYLKQMVDELPEAGVDIHEFTAVGGGARSEAWVQLSADILGRPFRVPEVTEAGCLGAAILAGVGSGVYSSHRDGVDAAVRYARHVEPDPDVQRWYAEPYALYRRTWPLMAAYLREVAALPRH